MNHESLHPQSTLLSCTDVFNVVAVIVKLQPFLMHQSAWTDNNKGTFF